MEADEQLRRAPKPSPFATDAVAAGLRKSAGSSWRGGRPIGNSSSLPAIWLTPRRKSWDLAGVPAQCNIVGTARALITEAVRTDVEVAMVKRPEGVISVSPTLTGATSSQ